MRQVDRSFRFGRRSFLRTTGLAMPAAMLASTGMANTPEQNWGLTAQSLRPATLATLVRMARDIYPHDSVPDRYYVDAIGGLDKKAKDDAVLRDFLESGVAALDLDSARMHQRPYLELADEAGRVALLQAIADSAFFQRVRSDLVVSLYNQPDLWTLFGYEGSSFDKGGYLQRGFDDLDWLPKG